MATWEMTDSIQANVEVIRKATQGKQKGSDNEYLSLIYNIQSSKDDDVKLLLWLRSLKRCVHLLSKEMDTLVNAILRLPWATGSGEVAEEFIQFTAGLVALQTCYTGPCLEMLTKILVPVQPSPTQAVGPGRPDKNGLFPAGVYLHAHNCLKCILHQVPTCSRALLAKLLRSAPYQTKPARVHEVFARNLLHLSEYLPGVAGEVMEIVVDRMVKIDAALPMPSEMDPLKVAVDQGQGQQQVFDMDVDLCTGGDSDKVLPLLLGDQSRPPTLHAALSETPVMTDAMAERMDVLMTVVLEHFLRITHPNGQFNEKAAAHHFTSILKVFESIIMRALGCTHIQFLVFYFASFSPEFVKEFLDFLWGKFICPSSPDLYRLLPMVYMTSFVARATFVSARIAKEFLSVVMQWIHQYIDEVSDDKLKPGPRVHSPFYSACQGIFYVIIFRYRDFQEAPGGMDFLRKLNFDRVIASRLNPLKICLPSVVEEFARITKQLELVFCYSIIEKNKRVLIDPTFGTNPVARQPESQKSDAHLTVNTFLDCFFPFEPYWLKRSLKYIGPLYRHWSGEDSSDSEDEDESSERTDPFLEPSPGFHGSISPT